tara:strand:- start:275 stop:2227 length:1953 start_codon:yes stop_codon:yes gene_type:complete
MVTASIKHLLQDVDSHLHYLEKLGIKCAKRNGTVDDLDQKKSIDLATKIILSLIDHSYYDSAFNIVSRVCNMTMGPFKSACALVAAESYISHKQYLLATKLALLLAPLKGALKIKTAKQIAIKLRKHNQTKCVNQIYVSLQNNPTRYAQKAAFNILKSSNKESIDVTTLLNNVKLNLIQIEGMGISCAKRGGSVDDPAQKKAIDLATKIGLTLVEQGYYTSAFNIVSCLCNISMGPFKSACALAITTSLINNHQYDLAKQIALLTAPVRGKLKTETVKEIALKLHKKKQDSYVKEIYEALQKNPANYAQRAALEILSATPDDRVNIKTLLADVDKNLLSLEKIGIKCAKRGGSVDDPEQKDAIDLATKIGIALIEYKYYKSAFNIVENVCNIAMGPFKSHCALTIASGFINHNQYKYAEKIALLISFLKGKIIINTTCKITLFLIQKNHISCARNIYNALKKNKDDYALDMLTQLDFHFANRTSKKSPFVDTFHKKTSKHLTSTTPRFQNPLLQDININQLQSSSSNLKTSLSFDHSNTQTITSSNELALALQETFGSLIQEDQSCVSWSNKTIQSSSQDPFYLRLTHNDITYITGGDYNKTIICFNLKTGVCTRNKTALTKEDIHKYTLIFFKIIDNDAIYENNFVIEK